MESYMKNLKKLSLSLLVFAGVSTTQTRRDVDTAGSAITTPVSGTLDYTIFGAQDHEEGKRDIAQNIVLPADTAINGAVDIVTFGQAKQLKTEFNESDTTKNSKKKSHKKKSSDDKKSHKNCHTKKCRKSNNDDDSMTSENAESLL